MISDNLKQLALLGSLIKQALYITAIIRLCGYNDWQLPNVNQLNSMVNYSVSIPSNWLNQQYFINIQAGVLIGLQLLMMLPVGGLSILLMMEVIIIH